MNDNQDVPSPDLVLESSAGSQCFRDVKEITLKHPRADLHQGVDAKRAC